MKIFYRVQQNDTTKGLWYDRDGTFNGRIEDDFSWLRASSLPMEPNVETAGGWLSATDSIETLFDWFNPVELKRLQSNNIYTYAYHATAFKWYDPYQHHLIRDDSPVIGRFMVT